jgi:uncharacterized coiled-coil protein SlyX
MSATAPADFWDKFHAERPGEAAPVATRPHPDRLAYAPPLGRKRRPVRAFLRFLVTIAVGVGGTLAWQAYGDTARDMAATAYPQQLGWLAPTTVAATAPAPAATVGAAAPVATPDQQQLAALSLSLADVRHSVETLAAQVASGQQQVASSQQQMAADIARLQASEQDILAKLSAPPRPTRPALAHKPAPLALNPAAPPAAAH